MAVYTNCCSKEGASVLEFLLFVVVGCLFVVRMLVEDQEVEQKKRYQLLRQRGGKRIRMFVGCCLFVVGMFVEDQKVEQKKRYQLLQQRGGQAD